MTVSGDLLSCTLPYLCLTKKSMRLLCNLVVLSFICKSTLDRNLHSLILSKYVSVVDMHVSKTVTKFKLRPTKEQRCPLYIKLPWIGNRSIAFEQQIKKAVRACFDDAEVRTSYTTRLLMNFTIKDSIPTLLRNKIVYQFKCLCGERYVGRTEQRLMERVIQHVPSGIRNPGRGKSLPDANRQKSAIGKHLCESKACGDAYDESWFSIVDTARSSFHLSTLEASYISSQDPSLCRQKQFVYTLQVFK